MYRYPERPFHKCSSPPDPQLYRKIEENLAWYDNQEYLHPTTREICQRIVNNCNIPYSLDVFDPGLDQPHVQVYKLLRIRLREMEMAGKIIEELSPPRGHIRTIEERYAELQTAQITSIDHRVGGNLAGEQELSESSDSGSSEDEWEDYPSTERYFEVDI
jgi:hypothetical protein